MKPYGRRKSPGYNERVARCPHCYCTAEDEPSRFTKKRARQRQRRRLTELVKFYNSGHHPYYDAA